MCLKNINKLYKYSEILNTNSSINLLLRQQWSPLFIDSLTTVQFHLAHIHLEKSIARKYLSRFSEVINVKHKSDVCGLGADKLKCKSARTGIMLWFVIPKRQVHTQIN